jgi:hypothetical protein
MLHFSSLKCIVWVWTLTVVGVVATKPNLHTDQARALDHHTGQVRQLLQPSRYCIKKSRALTAALNKLGQQASLAQTLSCPKFGCTFNFASLPAYNGFKKACSAEKGALAAYKVFILCPDGFNSVIENVSLCLVSKNVNKRCGPNQLVDDLLETFYDYTACTETVTNTGYTDFSGTKPVMKPVKRPVRRRNSTME